MRPPSTSVVIAAELARDADQEARDPVRADEPPARRQHAAAAVGREDHVGREQGEQRRRVGRGECVHEAVEQPFMLIRWHLDSRPFASNPRARAVHQLPYGVRAPLEDARDLRVLRVEDVAKQKGRTLHRREAFEQEQQGDRQVGRELGGVVRRRRTRRRQCRVGGDRLRQPGARVGGALGLQSPQAVHREPGHHGDQPRFGCAHHVLIGELPTQESLLHHVLGFMDVAQHPIGEAKQPRPISVDAVIVADEVGRRFGVECSSSHTN